MELLLGVRINPIDKLSVIKLNDVNLKDNVANFKIKSSQQINLPSDSFDLIYCGCLLENNSTLESCGLKSGSMIHVLKKNETKDAPTANSVSAINSEINVDMLTSIFKSFIGYPLLELAMRRLTKKPDVIENIISSSPGLSEDAVAIAILQDPDLIVYLTNSESINRIVKLHPALLEAAHHIASAVHDEAHNFAASSTSVNSSSLSNVPTTGHSYSLENLSDDEEMAGDSSQSSDSTQQSNSTNQSGTNSTLNSQFMSALSRTRSSSTSNESNNVNNSSTPVSSLSRTNSNSGGVITFEMFYQAMQQAFASNPATNSSENTTQSSSQSAYPNTFQNSSPNINMQRQITIMHEMGLQNDAINIQALQLTNGDVQAAIELVLSGFGDN